MSCTNSLNRRAQIYLEAKVENNSGGFSITDTLIYTLWCGVDFVGSETEESGARTLRYDKYMVWFRESPILDTKRAVNKLKFVLDDGTTIQPVEFKIKSGLATFECLERHED